MSVHYQADIDYSNKQEEIADMHDAIKSKFESKKPENIKDFDEFLKDGESDKNVQSKDR